MKTKRLSSGKYEIKLHGETFILEKMFGRSCNWSLFTSNDTEINQAETKSGMLELMSYWTEEYTKEQSKTEWCPFA